MATFFRRLAYFLRRSRREAELREEMEAHREHLAARLEHEGLGPDQADRVSRKAFGNVLLARDDAREAWLGTWDTWAGDIRYGIRTLSRQPAFAAVAIVTLALGIGVNTGIFAMINAVLLREIRAPHAHELFSISQAVDGDEARAGQDTFSTAEYFAYRERTKTMSSVAAYANARGEATLGGATPRKILGQLVSCNYFDVLQRPPMLGRALAASDCAPGAELVVILSHELWRTAFGADTAIVGRVIELNRQRATVVGVAGEGTYTGVSFVGGGYFAPLDAGTRLSTNDERYRATQGWLRLLGRKQAGVTLDQLRAEFGVLSARIARETSAGTSRLYIARAQSNDGLRADLRSAATAAAALLVAAFGAVLLIACANVANLLLTRGTSRSQEIAVRVSVGATRARVVRQLVTESLMLSAAGGLLGSVVAVWSFQALASLALPALLPPWLPLSMTLDLSADWRVLIYAVLLTTSTGVLFGLAPALHASDPELQIVMKQDTPGAGTARRGSRLRGALVGVQVTLCMVLMVAAGLLLRGLHATYSIDPGFDYRKVAWISLESAFDGDSDERAAARQRLLLDDLRSIPGVDGVAVAGYEPLGDDVSPMLLRLPGEDATVSRVGQINPVSANFFRVLDLPIVRGRTFTDAEVESAQASVRPAIVTRATAHNLWPGREPIGETLLASPAGGEAAPETFHVVGVVADAHIRALGEIDPFYVYVPGSGSAVLVRGRGDVESTVAAIQKTISLFDPAILVTVLPLEATLGWSRGISGTVTLLFTALGVLALLLASVGIYGAVSFAVAGRYREIGIRMALGASLHTVLGMILRQTMRPVVVGAFVGVIASAWLSRALTSVLFGVSPADAIGLGGAVVLVAAVALTGGLVATLPIMNGNPIKALRCD